MGAIATVGVIVGAPDYPMLMGSMIMGPLAGFVIKKFDKAMEGRMPAGFEMLINNFSVGIFGMLMAQDGRCDLAIVFCGTGIGVLSAACKMKGIHPAACSDVRTARLARRVSNCNTLCLGAEILGPGLANDIVDAFVDAEFEGGRHLRYMEMIDAIEAGTFSL